MLQNLIKNSILDFFYYAGLYSGWYVKKAIDNFFCKTLNRMSLKYYMRIDFQVHNPKLTQEGCFETYIYHKRLCIRCYVKEAADSFFCKALYRK